MYLEEILDRAGVKETIEAWDYVSDWIQKAYGEGDWKGGYSPALSRTILRHLELLRAWRHRSGWLRKNYRDWLNSPEWEAIRARVLDRDHHRCRLCGKTDVPLEVHHVTYSRGWDSEADCVAVCRHCHRALHSL